MANEFNNFSIGVMYSAQTRDMTAEKAAASISGQGLATHLTIEETDQAGFFGTGHFLVPLSSAAQVVQLLGVVTGTPTYKALYFSVSRTGTFTAVTDSGTADAAVSTGTGGAGEALLTDTREAWAVNRWAHQYARYYYLGVRYNLRVTSNTATVLTGVWVGNSPGATTGGSWEIGSDGITIYGSAGIDGEVYIDVSDNRIKVRGTTCQSTTIVPTGTPIEVVLVSGGTVAQSNEWWLCVNDLQEGYGTSTFSLGNGPWFQNTGGDGRGANLRVGPCINVQTTGANDSPAVLQWPRLKVLAQWPVASDATATIDSGTADAAVSTTATTLTDTREAWSTNQWAGYWATYTTGGTTYHLYVYANTATVLTGLWTTSPGVTSGGSWSLVTPVGWTGVGDTTNKFNNWDESELPTHDGDTSYNYSSTVLTRQINDMETRAAIAFTHDSVTDEMLTTDEIFRTMESSVYALSGGKAVSGSNGFQIILLGASLNNKQARDSAMADSGATYIGYLGGPIGYPSNSVTANDYDWKEVGAPADLDSIQAGCITHSTGHDRQWKVTLFCLQYVFYTSLLPLAVGRGAGQPAFVGLGPASI